MFVEKEYNYLNIAKTLNTESFLVWNYLVMSMLEWPCPWLIRPVIWLHSWPIRPRLYARPLANQTTATLSWPHPLPGAGPRRESAPDVGATRMGLGVGGERSVMSSSRYPLAVCHILSLQKQVSSAKTLTVNWPLPESNILNIFQEAMYILGLSNYWICIISPCLDDINNGKMFQNTRYNSE